VLPLLTPPRSPKRKKKPQKNTTKTPKQDLIFIKDGLRLSFFVTMPPPPGFDFLAPLLHNDLRARVAACADASPPHLPPLLVVPLAWSHLSEFARLCASDPITQKARLCPLITQPITPASATSAVLLLADQIFRMMGASCGGGGGDGAGAAAAAKAAAASPAACPGVLQALAAAATAAVGRPSSGPGLATRLARVMSVTVGRSLADLVALLGAREGEAVGPAAAAAAALLSLEERTALRELLL
jgi:hypothetical protein